MITQNKARIVLLALLFPIVGLQMGCAPPSPPIEAKSVEAYAGGPWVGKSTAGIPLKVVITNEGDVRFWYDSIEQKMNQPVMQSDGRVKVSFHYVPNDSLTLQRLQNGSLNWSYQGRQPGSQSVLVPEVAPR